MIYPYQKLLPLKFENDNNKYLIENLTTLGPLHSMLCKGIEFTSRNQFPIVQPYTGELPENLCSIHRLRKKPDSLLRILCAHFFIELFMEGWPKGSIIAINSTGIGLDKRCRYIWLEGYHAMLDILKPIHIIR